MHIRVLSGCLTGSRTPLFHLASVFSRDVASILYIISSVTCRPIQYTDKSQDRLTGSLYFQMLWRVIFLCLIRLKGRGVNESAFDCNKVFRSFLAAIFTIFTSEPNWLILACDVDVILLETYLIIQQLHSFLPFLLSSTAIPPLLWALHAGTNHTKILVHWMLALKVHKQLPI